MIGWPKTFFWPAKDLHERGVGVKPQGDCNTVGPIYTASGYGSGTLSHSAVRVLDKSKYHASAYTTLSTEEIHTQNVDSDFKELSDPTSGTQKLTPSLVPQLLRRLKAKLGVQFCPILFVHKEYLNLTNICCKK